MFWDQRIGKYVQYSRVKRNNSEQVKYFHNLYAGVNDLQGRSKDLYVGRSVSEDFISWSEDKIGFGPDAIDRADSPKGLTRLDFYGGNISRYNEADDVYIGLPNAYGHWKFDLSQEWWQGDYVQMPSTMDVQLITSRDGIQWNRAPKRRPFIQLGPEGTFWSRQIYPDGNAIRVGDELWFYFAGLDVHHKEQSLRKSNGARGRAVLRIDGFISADADYSGGEIITKPLAFKGQQLVLNLATGAGGVAKVEIQDDAGRPMTGYTAAETDEINGNYIRKTVSWNGDNKVREPSGKTVRLCVCVSSCVTASSIHSVFHRKK